MKNFRLLPLLLALLLIMSSCVTDAHLPGAAPPPSADSSFNSPDSPADAEESFGRDTLVWEARAIPLDISAAITAAAYTDDKLLFISGGTLYSASVIGTDVSPLPIADSETPRNTRFICADADGNIWLASAGGHVAAWDASGAKLYDYEFDGGTDFQALRGGLFGLPDGKVGAIISTRGRGAEIYAFDLTSDSPEKAAAMTAAMDGGAVENSYAYLDDSALLTWDANAIYSVVCDDNYSLSEERTVIARWSDAGVYGAGAKVLGMSDKNTVIFMSGGILYALKKVPASTSADRTELTLAAVGYVPPELNAAVANFNASDEKCKVKIIAYDDALALNTEITAGRAPDLLLTDSLPFNAFAAKGLFEDLTPYFADNALVGPVRNALSTNGALYRAAPAFMIMTLFGNSDFAGSETGWTFGEMTALADESSASAFPSNWNRENALQFLVLQNIEEYVDWDSGDVRFDTPDFKAVLEAVKAFPVTNEQYEDDITLVNDGRQLTLQRALISHLDFARIDTQLGGKSIAKGFPGEGKSAGALLTTPFTLAMTAMCIDKDGAWRFLESALAIDAGCFASLQTKFDEQASLAASKEYAAEQSVYVNYPPMSENQLQRLEAFLAQVNTLAGGDRTISAIIAEEAAPYFAGQKSLDDAARIIQSRASIYVSEQR
jgi:hypothetical protein